MKKKGNQEAAESVKGAPADSGQCETAEALLVACAQADWGQVVRNGGPPCFNLEDGRFCLRARLWSGHEFPLFHKFVSLRDLLRAALERKP